jgi:alkylhydroperoxidase/carboxymuconolactone decarboxylase family protein YurZ
MMKQLIRISILLCLVVSIQLSGQEIDKKPVPTTQQIFEQFEAQYGFIPKTIVTLSQRPGTVPAFMQYGTSLMQNGPLTMREFNLVTLSAAVALKSQGCIENQIKKLKRLGVSDDEIIQVVLIAGMLGNTTMLQDAYQALESQSLIIPAGE